MFFGVASQGLGGFAIQAHSVMVEALGGHEQRTV
jgi:hypothetical protein